MKLYPVYGTSGENKSFWEATPTGSIELMISNPAVFDRFRPEQQYYIDFTPADQAKE